MEDFEGFRVAALDLGWSRFPFVHCGKKCAKKRDRRTDGHDLAKIGHPGTPNWTPKWPPTVHLNSKRDPPAQHLNSKRDPGASGLTRSLAVSEKLRLRRNK